MKFGAETAIMYYPLPDPKYWELTLYDGLYGRESFWTPNITY
jgi:hypothetical protein